MENTQRLSSTRSTGRYVPAVGGTAFKYVRSSVSSREREIKRVRSFPNTFRARRAVPPSHHRAEDAERERMRAHSIRMERLKHQDAERLERIRCAHARYVRSGAGYRMRATALPD